MKYPLHFENTVGPSAHLTFRSLALHYWFSISLLAVLILSNASIFMFTIGGHYVAEPLIILVVAVGCADKATRNCVFLAFRLPVFVGGTLGLIGLLIIGGLTLGSFTAAYADFRACEALLFCYALVKINDWSCMKKADAILDTAILGLLVSVADLYFFPDANSPKVGCNIMLCPLGLYLSARKSKSFKFGLVLCLSTFVAIASFYRTYWVVVALSAVCFGTLLMQKMWRRSPQRVVLQMVFFLSGFALLIKSNLVEQYFRSSEQRYIQSIAKTQDLISVVSGKGDLKPGDEVRMAYFKFLIEYPERTVFPRGLGYRASFGNLDPFFDQFDEPGNTVDSGFFYLAYHLGTPLACFLIAGYLGVVCKRLRRTSWRTKTYIISGLLVTTVYLFSVGDLFAAIQRGAVAGAFLGLLANRRF